MDRQEIESKTKAIIVEKLGIEPDEVKKDADFEKDLGADSLDQAFLIIEFEKVFKIDIPDDKAESCKTVGDAYDLIEELV